MKTLVTLFLLPLGLTLALMAAALAALWRPRAYAHGGRALAGTLLALALAVGYVSSTPVVGRALTLGLMRMAQNTPDADPNAAQAIIVLTSGMYWAGKDVGWMPSPGSMHRMAVAYEIQRMLGGRVSVIVSGGHTHGFNAPSEARVVADFFARNRSEVVPTELEEVSTNTYESAMQLAPILAKRAAQHVILVTGEAHLARAMAVYRARGVDVLGIPALGLWDEGGVEGWLPSAEGLMLTTDAVYEWLGLAEYLVGGKMKLQDLTINNKG